ncbi:MAG: hypothetical protein NWE93_01280 [Candidatus Bathyarchaeota archaeon]|nr:hypothetical protein [Candidatus Bathyarchaeota archaeon]
MILEYNILWFENRTDYYELCKPNIAEYLSNLGFSPSFFYFKDGSEIADLTKRKDLDLILIDQNLRFNFRGDDLVSSLRKEGLFTEVILYSQYRDFEENITKNLDGVYYTDREHLEEKAQKVIEMTLRRDLDMSNIRGTFIAETIYAASQMEELITKIFQLSEPLSSFLKEQMQDENFSDFLKYKIIKRYLSEEIKLANMEITACGKAVDPKLIERRDRLVKMDVDFNNFKDDIIEFRNQLAHGKKCEDKRNVLVIKSKNNHNLHEQPFDIEYCKGKRNLFKEYSKLLQEIHSII